MATTSISLSPPDFLSVPKPKSYFFLKPNSSSLPLSSPATAISSKKTIFFQYPLQRNRRKSTQIWRIYATPDEAALPPEANPLENSQQIVSSGDDGVNYIVSFLLFIAFVGLSILTLGVIYIAVTDFLQKREKEKFEKEEAAKKKNGGKKKKVRARAGPRGFGQKVEVEVEEEEEEAID